MSKSTHRRPNRPVPGHVMVGLGLFPPRRALIPLLRFPRHRCSADCRGLEHATCALSYRGISCASECSVASASRLLCQVMFNGMENVNKGALFAFILLFGAHCCSLSGSYRTKKCSHLGLAMECLPTLNRTLYRSAGALPSTHVHRDLANSHDKAPQRRNSAVQKISIGERRTKRRPVVRCQFK